MIAGAAISPRRGVAAPAARLETGLMPRLLTYGAGDEVQMPPETVTVSVALAVAPILF
jgi:hypothetical protein